MGMLIDGVWCDSTNRYMQDGAFKRETSELPTLSAGEIAACLQNKTNIVLVASQSCPWSHRTTLVRALKDLEKISVALAGGPRVEGYALTGFPELDPGADPIRHVHQLYTATDPTYTGRATVPVLWDTSTRRILSNSSAGIARALDQIGNRWRLAPDMLADEIDALNTGVYEGLANAVYRAGFATAQSAYLEATRDVFATLDWLESHLAKRRCLFGQQVTESDLFLFATLVRFDAVYAPLFRCTRRRLVEYPALWAYARDVYSWPGIADTFDFEANLTGYFQNDTDNNPHGIVPELPGIDWTEPHGRDRLGALTVWQNDALIPFKDVGGGYHAA
ncbi:glutathione S-transferase C-terminal domain-containing protein [Marivita hallyeonensis]|uniref:Putative glutathione S-transferase n=1 Tax=Marivita hallyeonensis TaxID=996342 RepID=A0A1M5W3V5_9RHOB|nr:glutathione S-transferase C-terminal domain-containing protein [Marivita hallyeonensis]SHH81883.1 putative glutathione S-transferase [Marivita hallyeonensis]